MGNRNHHAFIEIGKHFSDLVLITDITQIMVIQTSSIQRRHFMVQPHIVLSVDSVISWHGKSQPSCYICIIEIENYFRYEVLGTEISEIVTRVFHVMINWEFRQHFNTFNIILCSCFTNFSPCNKQLESVIHWLINPTCHFYTYFHFNIFTTIHKR